MPKEQLKTLSEQMYFVLLSLHRERCGVEISNHVAKLTKQRIQLGPGTLYAILSKFEEENLIVQTRSEGRKKWYLISELGKQLFLEEYERLLKIIEETSLASLEG